MVCFTLKRCELGDQRHASLVGIRLALVAQANNNIDSVDVKLKVNTPSQENEFVAENMTRLVKLGLKTT